MHYEFDRIVWWTQGKEEWVEIITILSGQPEEKLSPGRSGTGRARGPNQQTEPLLSIMSFSRYLDHTTENLLYFITVSC